MSHFYLCETHTILKTLPLPSWANLAYLYGEITDEGVILVTKTSLLLSSQAHQMSPHVYSHQGWLIIWLWRLEDFHVSISKICSTSLQMFLSIEPLNIILLPDAPTQMALHVLPSHRPPACTPDCKRQVRGWLCGYNTIRIDPKLTILSLHDLWTFQPYVHSSMVCCHMTWALYLSYQSINQFYVDEWNLCGY